MYPPTKSKTRSANDLFNGAYAMFCVCVCNGVGVGRVLIFFFFFPKRICCGYLFELHGQVDAIQMGTHNISLYKEVDKKYTGCIAGLGGAVGCASDWRPGGRGFDPRRGRQHSFVEIDHEIFSTVILSLPLIQEGQLSVSGERMCTILVNRLED